MQPCGEEAMMLRTSFALTLSFSIIALTQAGGCGGAGSSGGDACGEYFDAFYHCAALPNAPSSIDHLRDRFTQLCERAMALPGTSFTEEQVSECGKAYKDSACDGPPTPAACQTKPGT